MWMQPHGWVKEFAGAVTVCDPAGIITIEKAGKKKLIYQTPWHTEGEYRGFVELSLELPAEMPHFVRQP
jgi:hypothetical protein